jgi:glutaconate CoA-transferase subunit B
MIYYCARRTVVFRTEHTRRSLVERVDFISAAGSSPANVLRLGNPSKLITPKANFRFDKDEARLRLDSIHPSYTVGEIRENTGFDLSVTEPVVTTPAPTAEELRVLTSVVRSTPCSACGVS